jgi:hypothetical protein
MSAAVPSLHAFPQALQLDFLRTRLDCPGGYGTIVVIGTANLWKPGLGSGVARVIIRFLRYIGRLHDAPLPQLAPSGRPAINPAV